MRDDINIKVFQPSEYPEKMAKNGEPVFNNDKQNNLTD